MLTEALKRLSKHSLIYALGPAIQKVLAFALLPFVTAWIGGRGEYGAVEIAAVTIAVGAQVLGINVLYGATRFFGLAADDRERHAILSTTLWMLVATTGGALVAATLLRASIAALLFGNAAKGGEVVVVFAILACQTAGQVGLRWLQMRERSVAYGVVTTVKMLVEIGLKVALLLAGLESMGVLLSVLGGEVLVALGTIVAVARTSGFAFSREIAVKLVRFSAPLVVSGLFMFALHQADRFVLLRARDDAEVGVYGLAYKLGSSVNAIVLEAFGLIWFPFVFALRDEAHEREVVRRVTVYFTALCSVATLALALFSDDVVRVMAAPDFAGAAELMPWIAFGYLGWAVFQMVHTAFYLRARTVFVTWLVGGAAVLNLALNLWLAPIHGARGAAWATLVTFAALAVAAWITAERVWRVGHDLVRVLAPIALAALLALAGRHLPAWDAPAVVVAKVGLVLALPLALLCGGYLDPSEKAKIRAALASVRNPRR